MQDDITILRLRDSEYPTSLRQINDPPERIYVRGNLEVLEHPNLLATVGARKANTYAKQAAQKLLPDVVRAGAVLVSGLAYGVDSMAHKAAVDLKRPTIAVLGSGIDDRTIYPPTNVALARHIIEYGGAVISEYSPGTPAQKHRFPARNRIIAGLCRATIVIQASIRSGSLITARLALEYNRDVGAVPGAITDPLSEGTNYLIQNGAATITHSQDILDLIGLSVNQQSEVQPALVLTADQEGIISLLTTDPQHMDDLIQKAGLPAHHISAVLMELELSGHVQNVGNMRYVRKA